jgi:hypothetical protein
MAGYLFGPIDSGCRLCIVQIRKYNNPHRYIHCCVSINWAYIPSSTRSGHSSSRNLMNFPLTDRQMCLQEAHYLVCFSCSWGGSLYIHAYICMSTTNATTYDPIALYSYHDANKWCSFSIQHAAARTNSIGLPFMKQTGSYFSETGNPRAICHSDVFPALMTHRLVVVVLPVEWQFVGSPQDSCHINSFSIQHRRLEYK